MANVKAVQKVCPSSTVLALVLLTKYSRMGFANAHLTRSQWVAYANANWIKLSFMVNAGVHRGK
jgi:hypothetical protein